MKICQIILNIALKFGQILNKPSKKLPKTLKIWPKWRNFAKSGHTDSQLTSVGGFLLTSMHHFHARNKE